jgi:hypothetical protein
MTDIEELLEKIKERAQRDDQTRERGNADDLLRKHEEYSDEIDKAINGAGTAARRNGTAKPKPPGATVARYTPTTTPSMAAVSTPSKIKASRTPGWVSPQEDAEEFAKVAPRAREAVRIFCEAKGIEYTPKLDYTRKIADLEHTITTLENVLGIAAAMRKQNTLAGPETDPERAWKRELQDAMRQHAKLKYHTMGARA